MSTPTLSSVQPSSTTPIATFSPSSSPPLILAFLAIGLFSTAMIFIFWRRIQANRSWSLTAPHINESYFELPIMNDDIPKLWDLSNAGSFAHGQDEKGGAGREVNVTWVNLMPLSLSTTTKVVHSSAADGSVELRRNPHHNHNFLHTISNLNPMSRTRPSSCRDDDDEGKNRLDESVTMRVAVTIALPSPEYPIHIRSKDTDKRQDAKRDTDREHMTDYCIGLYECPWP